MKKKLMAFLALISVVSSAVVGFAGCKPKVQDDENTLEIFISKFGYGTEWLDEVIKEFKNTAWVQEKYPSLNIPKPASNSERTFPADRMITDGSTNTYDLLFACDSAAAYYDRVNAATGESYFEDLSGVYATTIPGESVTVSEKMDANIYANLAHTNKDGTTAYYSMPWVNGYMGLLYNQSLVDTHLGASYVLPRTTIELEGMAKTLKDKNVTPFLSSTKSGYWNQVCFTWWVQYEGTERYADYWLGVNEYDEMSSENFAQLGRLRSLQTLESLIGRSDGKDYNHADVNTLEFTAAQSKYLLGEAVMMPNGDWFENEMRANYEEDENHYDIRFMQMPVISAIVETLSFYNSDKAYDALSAAEKATYDDMLAKIVSVVDADGSLEDAQALVSGLTKADFDKVSTARNVVYSVENHDAYIPSYATGKEIAKDFLIFMASDKAIETFMRSTNGASTAFTFDVETKAPDLYASFSNLQKGRAKIAAKGIVPFAPTTSRLVYLGGLNNYTIASSLESFFTAQNAADRKTAEYIYQNDIEYYVNKNNGEYWKELLSRAGIQN